MMSELYTLHQGDCADILPTLDIKPQLILTSPPYDNLRDYGGHGFDFDRVADAIVDVMPEGSVLVWVVGDRIKGGRSLTSFRQALHFQDLGFSVHDVMIYQKKNTPFMRSNAYTNAYEMMLVLSKGKPAVFNPLKMPTQRNGSEKLTHNKLPDGINKKKMGKLNKEKVRTNIWSYAVGLGGTTTDRVAFQHPAVFPEQLALDHILSWSNPGDLVLDPMCGSGTVLSAAVTLGRQAVGIEIQDEYCDIIRKRMESIQAPML